jgi:tRNA A-37 threonylcarbamoyl transferase component Bud32
LILDTLRYRAQHLDEQWYFEKLSLYLKDNLPRGIEGLPVPVEGLVLRDVSRIGGGLYNDVLCLTLSDDQGSPYRLILKTYRPYLNHRIVTYDKEEEHSRYTREFEALRCLYTNNFPCPNALLCEPDDRYIGYPFVIMTYEAEVISRAKLGVKKNANLFLDSYAARLAELHNLQISKVNIKGLSEPSDEFSFARSWPVSLRYFLNLEPKHKRDVSDLFDRALDWLDRHADCNPCHSYSILHGDTHPKNSMMTQNRGLILHDFEDVLIGDPAYDIAKTYHFIKFF